MSIHECPQQGDVASKSEHSLRATHEFVEARLPAPRWTGGIRLEDPWILDTPCLTDAEIKRQTPPWLAERNIFIAEKDLVTL